MGQVDSVPVVSQIASAVDAAKGRNDRARERQENFSKQCIGISQMRSAVSNCSSFIPSSWLFCLPRCQVEATYDVKAARRTQKEFLKGVERTAKAGTYGPAGKALAKQATKNRPAACLIVDASGNDYWLNKAWKIGSGFGGFDIIIKETESFEDAIRKLKRELGSRSIRELQFWCHGNDGIVCCGENDLDAHNVDVFSALSGHFVSDGRIWFRCCSTAKTAVGEGFMHEVARQSGARFVAAHNQKIGPIQNGLRLWDAEEQCWRGPKDTDMEPARRLEQVFSFLQ
mmetsp:Transcript_28036/g.56806  ORF Transcript_28036/g.56806 Transcript_28036/m.56806 type:complete len:285 (+) Transcript_28036:16-870(+)